MADDPLETAIDHLTPTIRPGGVVLIGEFHGTEQFPTLAAGLARAAADADLAVTVGLEIPCSEQARLDDVLADPSIPVAGPWWDRSAGFRDGRSSGAMAELVRSLGRLGSVGCDVAVVAMDGPWVAPGSPIPLELLGELEQDRDEGMAMRLLDAIDRRRRAFTVVLAGSEHTGVVPRTMTSSAAAGGRVERARRPMGSFVLPWHRQAVALVGRSSGGTAWLISGRGDAGRVEPVSDDGGGLPPGAMWVADPGDDGHHGYVHVGAVTASEPHADEPHADEPHGGEPHGDDGC